MTRHTTASNAPRRLDKHYNNDGDTVESHASYFEHEGNRAAIDRCWKLAALKNEAWESYDIEKDRTELVNLAADRPSEVTRLPNQ